jgi:hypothetical protein
MALDGRTAWDRATIIMPNGPKVVLIATSVKAAVDPPVLRLDAAIVKPIPSRSQNGFVECYSAALACDAERRLARYRTPSASVRSSCMVPAGTLQESPGP